MIKVDFIGVPGVGKTTLYKELLKDFDFKRNYLTPTEAEIESAIFYYKQKNGLKNYSRYLLLKSLLFKRLNSYLINGIPSSDFVYKNRNKYQRLIQLAFRYINESNDPPILKIKNIASLEKEIEFLSKIESLDISRPVLFDEGLTQKVFTYLINDLSKDEIKNELRKISLPDFFVYLYSDENLINTRLINRDRVIFEHRFLNDDEILDTIRNKISCFEKGVKVLTEVGVKGIKINTRESLEENTKVLKKYLKNII